MKPAECANPTGFVNVMSMEYMGLELVHEFSELDNVLEESRSPQRRSRGKTTMDIDPEIGARGVAARERDAVAAFSEKPHPPNGVNTTGICYKAEPQLGRQFPSHIANSEALCVMMNLGWLRFVGSTVSQGPWSLLTEPAMRGGSSLHTQAAHGPPPV